MEQENKKKRFRPSLTAYRKLEEEKECLRQELEKQREEYEKSYKTLELKYRHTEDALRKQNEACERMSKNLEMSIEKAVQIALERGDVVRKEAYNTTEQSNRLLEEELIRVKGQRTELEKKLVDCRHKILHYESRGFFARLFNR